MQRRTLLVGTGTAFVAVLAGCTGADDDPDDDSDDHDDADGGDSDDGDDSNGYDDSDGDDSDYDDSDDHDDSDHDGSDDHDDVPGFDAGRFESLLEEHGISVDSYHYDGEELVLEFSASGETDVEGVLEVVGKSLAAGVDDPDVLESGVTSIRTTVYDEGGDLLVSVAVRIEWAIELAEDEIDVEEFVERVREE